MIDKINKILLLLILSLATSFSINATTISPEVVEHGETVAEEELNVKELILGHLADSYEWQPVRAVPDGRWR